jgi:hypothetical protein
MRLHINRQAFLKIRILLQFPCMSEWLLSAMGLAAVTSFFEAVATASAAVATGSAAFFFRTAVAAEEFLVTGANSMSASYSDEKSFMFHLIWLINKHLNLHIYSLFLSYF